MNITLRPVTSADRRFVEHVYFSTQRWIIDKLFGGWRGDDIELTKFAQFYDEKRAEIINIDGEDSGWIDVAREETAMSVNCIFLLQHKQQLGIGSFLLKAIINEAISSGKSLRIATAKINPARFLYQRLGFVVIEESEYKLQMELQAA
jgi:GNAT superfamily N-acetyltransferase